MRNQTSLDTVCGSLAYAMGIEPPRHAAAPNPDLVDYINEKLEGRKADRIFMYNPDAIAQWIYEKYSDLLREVTANTDIALPLESVMPPVTPVCFATMYTGAKPEIHGIRKYERPIVKIDTLFDAMIRAGKKCAIVANAKCSMGMIFLEKDMDYYLCSSLDEINAKGAQLILEDKYDLLVVYNGNYDARMHKFSPEGLETLCELRANSEVFAMFSTMIKEHWKDHDTLVGFAMDHGCHHIDDGLGSHGLDMDEDMNILHRYKIYPKKQ